MPDISCPGCSKRYRIDASIVGRAVTCKACGKKFRAGAPRPTPKPAAKAAVKSASASEPARESKGRPAFSDVDWDEELAAGVPGVAPVEEPVDRSPVDPQVDEYLAKARSELATRRAEDEAENQVSWGGVTVGLAGGVFGFLCGVVLWGLAANHGGGRNPYLKLCGLAFAGGTIAFCYAISSFMGKDGTWGKGDH